MNVVLPSNRTVWVLVPLILFLIGALLGYRLGLGRGMATIDAQQAILEQRALDTAQASAEAERKSLQRRVLELQEQLQIDGHTIDRLHEQLATAGREHQTVQRELELYRRIEQNTQSTGLVMDSLRGSVRDATPILNLTLLQYRGRNRVSGSIGVRVLAGDDPEAKAVDVFEAGVRGSPRFNLRFFETLEIPLPAEALTGFETPWVEITIRPEDSAHKTLTERRAWSGLVAE